MDKSSDRNSHVDTLKGALVLLMVFYHCASVAANSYKGLAAVTEQLFFLHSAFLILSGFLCGWHYSPKEEGDAGRIAVRLRIRALKLVLLFAALNAVIYILQLGAFSAEFLATIVDFRAAITNILANVNGSLFGFEILLYIAYFLFFASFQIAPSNKAVVTLLLLVVALLLTESSTILYLLYGYLGMVIGRLLVTGRLEILSSVLGVRMWIFPLLLVMYLAVPHSLGETHFMSGLTGNIFRNLIETVLWFGSILFLLDRTGFDSLDRWIALLGAYTLFSYVFQMFVIRVVFVSTMDLKLGVWVYYSLNVLVSGLVLTLSVLLLQWSRQQFRFINRTYKLVFQ